MSDMLQANQDQPKVDDVISVPDQDQSDIDDDVIRIEPLFQDGEEDSTPIAPQGRRRRLWFIVVSIVLLVVLIGGGALLYMRRADASQVQYTTNPSTYGKLTQNPSATGPPAAKDQY